MTAMIGPLEIQALAYAQRLSQQSLAAGELAAALGWTSVRERGVLSRLASKGLIVRVRRGLYLVPPSLPAGTRWSPGEFLALSTLIGDRGGTYQISGPNAFYRYGWTDQVPNRLYVYNNRISGERTIGPISLTLIKVAGGRLGGVEMVRTPEGIEVIYASKSRALVDAVDDWSRFATLPKAFNWITQEVKRDDALAAALVQATVRFGNQGTTRRVGALLDRMEIQEPLLRKLEVKLNQSSSLIAWIPGRKKRGQISKRWGVVFNDEQ
jgi:predicted transcriptional regulator of viral defense system